MISTLKGLILKHAAPGTVIFNIAAACVVALVVWLLLRLAITILRKRGRNIRLFQFSDQFLKLVKKIVGLSVLFGTGMYVLTFIEFPLLNKILLAVFTLLVAGPLNSMVKIVIQFLQQRLADKTDTRVDDIVFDILDKFSGIIIYTAAVIIAMDALGVNIMPFVAGAGVAGVAIGFAAKDTLSNFIAGVLLLIDRPFEVGDRIELWEAPAGSATWGDVINIGLRATTIRNTDNIEIIIPNNIIMTRDIVNYTATSSSIRVRVNIGVSYDTDIAKAKALIVEVTRSLEWVLADPAPKVVVRNFGESSVDLQLRVWISNARKRMDTISEVTDRVKAVFDREGIEIPYPKRDITIIQKTENGNPLNQGGFKNQDTAAR